MVCISDKIEYCQWDDESNKTRYNLFDITKNRKNVNRLRKRKKSNRLENNRIFLKS